MVGRTSPLTLNQKEERGELSHNRYFSLMGLSFREK
jgi:hypothetical protein